jgi:hypothetical protein
MLLFLQTFATHPDVPIYTSTRDTKASYGLFYVEPLAYMRTLDWSAPGKKPGIPSGCSDYSNCAVA